MFQDLADDEHHVFEFDQIPLDVVDGATLGQGYASTAAAGEGAGNIDYIQASVGVVIDAINWELRNTRRLCSLRLTLSVSSSVAFRMSSCTVICKLGSPAPRSTPGSDRVEPLRFYDFAPKKLDRRSPTSATITKKKELSPQIQVPPGFGFSLFSWKRAETFTRESGTDFKIDRTSSLPDSAEKEFDTLTLRATANEYQREGLQQTFEIEAIIEHHEKEFWIDFDIDPSFSFNTMIRHPRRILKRGLGLISRRKFVPKTTQ